MGAEEGKKPVCRGDFACMVTTHGLLVLTVAERITGDHEEALDVSQEAFLQAFLKLHQLRDPEKLKSWLVRITTNVALGKLRARRNEPVTLHLGQGTNVTVAEEALQAWRYPEPSESVEEQEMRRTIHAGLSKLASEHRTVITLFYLKDYKLTKIADELGLPLGTVKWHLSEARKRLRKELIMEPGTDEIRNGSTGTPLLDVKTIWGTNGNEADLRPGEVTKTLLAQQILYVVRKELMDPNRIGQEVKADVRYVKDHIGRMTRAEVLQEEAGRYRANCILLEKFVRAVQS